MSTPFICGKSNCILCHGKNETLKAPTAATPRLQVHYPANGVHFMCWYNVHRICQPTNSLFRKPYNEINSDEIYVANATAKPVAVMMEERAQEKTKMRMKDRAKQRES